MHTDSYDEALALPTDEAALIALRTQQIIAEETGVANTVDPLGGSYYVESLTEKMIDGCFDYFDKIDGFGGMVEAVEAGFPQREIQESAYQYQKAVERGEQTIVGVNKYAMDEEIHKTDILQIDETVRDHQLERLAARQIDPRQRRRCERSRKTKDSRPARRKHDARDHRGRGRVRDGRRDLRRVA